MEQRDGIVDLGAETGIKNTSEARTGSEADRNRTPSADNRMTARQRAAVLAISVRALMRADGAAIKDSFGILQRVTFHQQIIARLWRFL